jgi:hypothetical protein
MLLESFEWRKESRIDISSKQSNSVVNLVAQLEFRRHILKALCCQAHNEISTYTVP